MPARVANIAPCITQVTFKLVHYALLIYQLRFVFTFLKVLANFPTDKYGLDCGLELNAKVFQLCLNGNVSRVKPLSLNRYTVTDIFDFVNEVRELKISKGDILVSYDVSSLFTNVPLDETIAILAEKAFRDNWFNSTHNLNISKEDLIDLLNVSTKGQLFQFNGALYEQIDGVAMGSPLGPLLANVFMSSLEEKLELEGKLPDYYRRYVDDTRTLMPNITTATDFLNTLNHAHPSVSFTMEIEKDGMLPFLGTQLLNRAPQIET